MATLKETRNALVGKRMEIAHGELAPHVSSPLAMFAGTDATSGYTPTTTRKGR